MPLVSLPDHSAHHDMGVLLAVVTIPVLFSFLLMTVSVLRSRSIVPRERFATFALEGTFFSVRGK